MSRSPPPAAGSPALHSITHLLSLAGDGDPRSRVGVHQPSGTEHASSKFKGIPLSRLNQPSGTGRR
uniref:Uncharacterized protein n=1 Tax=Setaria italica TaxID=4555 RepID=K3YXG6_SETIT